MTALPIERDASAELPAISWRPPCQAPTVGSSAPTSFDYLLAGWWSPESVATANDLVGAVDALLDGLRARSLLDHRIRAHGDLHKLARAVERNARRMRTVIAEVMPAEVPERAAPDAAEPLAGGSVRQGSAPSFDMWGPARLERPLRDHLPRRRRVTND